MKIKVGLFGAGDIADLHASGIKNCSSAQLVGLFDIDNQKAQQKSDNYNCLSYDSAESMLKDPLIDAIFVLTPLEEHFNCAINALNSGNLFRESNIYFAENVHNVDTDNSIDIVKTIENFFVQNAYYKLTKPIITCSPDMYYEFSDLIEPKDF